MAIMAISALSVGFSVFVLNVRHGAETYMEYVILLKRKTKCFQDSKLDGSSWFFSSWPAVWWSEAEEEKM